MSIEIKKDDHGIIAVTGAPKNVDVTIRPSVYDGWEVRARYVAYSIAHETNPLRLGQAVEMAISHLRELMMNDADGPVHLSTAIGDVVRVAPRLGLRFSHHGHIGLVTGRDIREPGTATVQWEGHADLPRELPFEFFAQTGIVPL